MAQPLAWKGTAESEIGHAHFDAVGLAEIIGHGLGQGNEASPHQDEIGGILHAVGSDPLVTAARQAIKFVESGVGDFGQVPRIKQGIGRRSLSARIVSQGQTGGGRIVDAPRFGNAASCGAEYHPLGGGGGVDDLSGVSRKGHDQIPLRQQDGFEALGHCRNVLHYQSWNQRLFGNTVGDQGQIRCSLHVSGKEQEASAVRH